MLNSLQMLATLQQSIESIVIDDVTQHWYR